MGSHEDGGKEVTLVLPEATTEGMVMSDKTPQKKVTVPIPESSEEAGRTIEQFEAAAREIRGEGDVSDTVVQHMMDDKTSLLDEKWLGTEEEELNA